VSILNQLILMPPPRYGPVGDSGGGNGDSQGGGSPLGQFVVFIEPSAINAYQGASMFPPSEFQGTGSVEEDNGPIRTNVQYCDFKDYDTARGSLPMNIIGENRLAGKSRKTLSSMSSGLGR
jgi:hypothetical protein